MALKQIMLRHKLNEARAELAKMQSKGPELEERAAELQRREAELSQAVDETPTDETMGEAQAALDAEIEAQVKDQEDYDKEKAEYMAEIERLQAKVAELEAQLAEVPAPETAQPAVKTQDRAAMRGRETPMKANSVFSSPEQRSAIVGRPEVRGFLAEVRALAGRSGQTRAVTGTELTIPDTLLGLLRDNLHQYSKLASKVDLRRVPGKSRLNLLGPTPEAVWMEATGTLNELEFGFSQISLDGWMVGGFIPIFDATLEDSDENLADEITYKLGQALGLALDKSILYGTGVKMPTGIVTRLAQTAKPADWDVSGPAWADLHTSNLLKVSSASLSGDKLFAELLKLTRAAKPNYSDGRKLWIMNSNTYTDIVAKTLTFNAAGAIVATQFSTMPILGGDVVDLEFVPDGDIIGGYASLYLLAERAGAALARSNEYRFLNNQTLFRGVARYDGQPILGEGFAVVNINGAAPTTSIAFAADTANTPTPPAA